MPRIMTYNVHRCVGVDGRLDVARVAAVIAQCRPDIVALQELDVCRLRTGTVMAPRRDDQGGIGGIKQFPLARVKRWLLGDAKDVCEYRRAGSVNLLVRMSSQTDGRMWRASLDFVAIVKAHPRKRSHQCRDGRNPLVSKSILAAGFVVIFKEPCKARLFVDACR